MKKKLFVLVLILVALGASAQNKGRFEMHEFDNFKLHVYYTNDALGDASYIIEGNNALITMEQPLLLLATTQPSLFDKTTIGTPLKLGWNTLSQLA